MKRVITAAIVSCGIWFVPAGIWHYAIESRVGVYWWNWPWYAQPLWIALHLALVLILIGLWIWALADG